MDDLISKIKQGDNEAFNNLVKDNLTMVLNFVYRFCYDIELAEDITQEVFIKIWRNINKYDEGKNFKTWMLIIAKNTAIDFLRKRRAIPFSSFEAVDGSNDFTENIQDERIDILCEMIKYDNQSQLTKVINSLNAKQQLVFYLYYYEELNFQEIADILHISVNTIKSQHLRGLSVLRQLMHPN